MPTVLRTTQAHLDLVRIALHIADENPLAADRWLDVIEEKCRLLAQMPGVGRKRDELGPGVRGLPVGDFVIFYRAFEDGIQVLRVLHGARDIPEIF